MRSIMAECPKSKKCGSCEVAREVGQFSEMNCAPFTSLWYTCKSSRPLALSTFTPTPCMPVGKPLRGGVSTSRRRTRTGRSRSTDWKLLCGPFPWTVSLLWSESWRSLGLPIASGGRFLDPFSILFTLWSQDQVRSPVRSALVYSLHAGCLSQGPIPDIQEYEVALLWDALPR